jgi:hypothetical protein
LSDRKHPPERQHSGDQERNNAQHGPAPAKDYARSRTASDSWLVSARGWQWRRRVAQISVGSEGIASPLTTTIAEPSKPIKSASGPGLGFALWRGADVEPIARPLPDPRHGPEASRGHDPVVPAPRRPGDSATRVRYIEVATVRQHRATMQEVVPVRGFGGRPCPRMTLCAAGHASGLAAASTLVAFVAVDRSI